MALSLDWVRSWRLSRWKDLGAQKDSSELDRVGRELEKLHPFPCHRAEVESSPQRGLV